jgi:hypothetical protein
MGTPIHKRKFYSFLSHSHANKDVVDKIESWLTEKAGLPIWYDSRFLPSGAKVASELGRAIEDCRSTILVLSKRSVESGWVEEEYNASVGERAGSRNAFHIIPVKIEECEVPSFLQTTNWIDISTTGFDLSAAHKLLLSLHSMDEELELGKTRDVFVSGSWREAPETEAWLVNAVCQTAKKQGFRLIGDSPDQQGFDGGDRVKEIISSCGGLIAVLPDRGSGKTSKYMIQEIEFAKSLGLSYVIIAEDTVEIAEELAQGAIETVRIPKAKVEEKADLSKSFSPALGDLKEQWKNPPAPHFVFYGTDFNEEHKDRIQMVKRLIQQVSAMPCYVGEDIRKGQIQQEIIKWITGAFMMVADISQDNLNTCIEAGIAVGAKTPLHLLAAGPRHKPPFMFRDQQVWYYENDVELLGVVHNLVLPYRRRIINYELQASLYH